MVGSCIRRHDQLHQSLIQSGGAFLYAINQFIVEGEVNIMHMFEALPSSVRSELSKLSTGMNNHPEAKERSTANCERLTRREWESVMGMDRDRYCRVNGKVRRK